MGEQIREFLFEYRFKGDEYGFTIQAENAREALERLQALPWAQYKGEIAATIPIRKPWRLYLNFDYVKKYLGIYR